MVFSYYSSPACSYPIMHDRRKEGRLCGCCLMWWQWTSCVGDGRKGRKDHWLFLISGDLCGLSHPVSVTKDRQVWAGRHGWRLKTWEDRHLFCHICMAAPQFYHLLPPLAWLCPCLPLTPSPWMVGWFITCVVLCITSGLLCRGTGLILCSHNTHHGVILLQASPTIFFLPAVPWPAALPCA